MLARTHARTHTHTHTQFTGKWYSVDQVVLHLPQQGESRRPSRLLEGGPVQPVHHCADPGSVVVAI